MMYKWKVRALKRPRLNFLWRYWRAWRGEPMGARGTWAMVQLRRPGGQPGIERVS